MPTLLTQAFIHLSMGQGRSSILSACRDNRPLMSLDASLGFESTTRRNSLISPGGISVEGVWLLAV
jgi:hypothetical protein